MTRGGPRAGAGRKPAEVKRDYVFYARVTKEEKEFLTKKLEEFKKEKRGD